MNISCFTGVLDKLCSHDTTPNLKPQACWTISNITAGTRDQIQAVIEANIVPPLVHLLATAEFDIKKEVSEPTPSHHPSFCVGLDLGFGSGPGDFDPSHYGPVSRACICSPLLATAE